MGSSSSPPVGGGGGSRRGGGPPIWVVVLALLVLTARFTEAAQNLRHILTDSDKNEKPITTTINDGINDAVVDDSIPKSNEIVEDTADPAAASSSTVKTASNNLRRLAGEQSTTDDRNADDEVEPDFGYWLTPIAALGLTCGGASIKSRDGQYVCIKAGEALCQNNDGGPFGRWTFGIIEENGRSTVNLWTPNNEVAWTFCTDVTHVCIGEERDPRPNKFSNERPYLYFYDEKTQRTVGNLTCDGTDGFNGENLGKPTILKMVDNSDVGMYANYNITVLKFKKGQTPDPGDSNELFNITVDRVGQNMVGFMSFKESKCRWMDFCPSEAPSSEPSTSPSSLPSADPSSDPSSSPSGSPSSLPSSMPSKEPSETPSSVPSDVPSNPPSNTTTNIAGRAAIAKTYDRMVLFGWSFDDISFSVYYTSWVTSLIIDASDAEGVANYIDSLDDISVNETGVVSELVLPDYRDHNLIDARVHLYLPKTVKSLCTRSENNTECRPVVCPIARGFDPKSTTRLTFAPSNTEILFGNDTTCSIKKPEFWDSWILDNFGENDTTTSDKFYLPDPDGDGLSNIMEYWGLDLSFLFADIAPVSQTAQSRRLGSAVSGPNCLTRDMQSGQCISTNDCALQGKVSVPWQSGDPSPNCQNLGCDVQCCVDRAPSPTQCLVPGEISAGICSSSQDCSSNSRWIPRIVNDPSSFCQGYGENCNYGCCVGPPLTGTDPNSFDTDGDLLSDYFERLYGLDPTTKDDINKDSDGDGLTDFEEQKHGTSPLKEDTDNDGLSDFVEVGAGSDPLSNKETSSEPGISYPIILKVGDHSTSNSERWILEVGPIVHQATEFGKVQTETYNIPIGFHRVTVKHRDTNRLVGGVPTPDFDYTANISWVDNPDWEITLEDPDNLLDVVGYSSKVDRTIGLEAYLTIKKIGGPSQLPCDYSTCESCNADSSCQWYSSRCSEWVQEYVEVKQPGVYPFATNEARRLIFFAGPTVPFIFHQGISVQMHTVTTLVEKDSVEKCPTYKCNSWIDIVEKNEPEWRSRLPRCPCKVDRVFVDRAWPFSDYYTIEPKGGTDEGTDWSADRTCKSPNLLSCEEEHDRHKGGTFGCLEWKGDIGLPLPYTFYEGVQECCYDAQYDLIPHGKNHAGVTALDGMSPITVKFALAAGGYIGGAAAVASATLPFPIPIRYIGVYDGVTTGVDLVRRITPPGYDFFGATFYNECCRDTSDSSGVAACDRYKGIENGSRGARGNDEKCIEQSCDETVFKNAGKWVDDPLLLDRRALDISLQAMFLSDLAYFNETNRPNAGESILYSSSPHGYSNFIIINSYVSEDKLDAAIVAKSNGKCFAAFRGTLPPDGVDPTDGLNDDELITVADWASNIFPVDDSHVCGGCGCCEARRAFTNTYYNDFEPKLRKDLLQCLEETCDMSKPVQDQDCLVLAGHSQGGAIAEVAAIVYADRDPIIATFGQPPAVKRPCPYLEKMEYYRYINTVHYGDFQSDFGHDPVAFLPGADDFGHAIILSDRNRVVTGVNPSENWSLPVVGDVGDLSALGVQCLSFLVTLLAAARPPYTPLNLETLLNAFDQLGIIVEEVKTSNDEFGKAVKAHGRTLEGTVLGYLDNLESLAEKNLSRQQVPAMGWQSGPCFFDKECLSGQCQTAETIGGNYDPNVYSSSDRCLPCLGSSGSIELYLETKDVNNAESAMDPFITLFSLTKPNTSFKFHLGEPLPDRNMGESYTIRLPSDFGCVDTKMEIEATSTDGWLIGAVKIDDTPLGVDGGCWGGLPICEPPGIWLDGEDYDNAPYDGGFNFHDHWQLSSRFRGRSYSLNTPVKK